MFVGEAPAPLFIGHALDRRGAIADAADHQRGGDVIGFSGADAAVVRVQPRALHAHRLHPALARYFHRRGEEIEIDRNLLGRPVRLRNDGIFAQQRHRFAHARLQLRIGGLLRQIGRVDARAGRFQPSQFTQLLGRHGNLMRAAAAQYGDAARVRLLQRGERMADDITVIEFGHRLGQDPRHVERDIAIADNHDIAPVQRRIQIGEIGVAIIPADKGRAAIDARQIAAGQAERPVVRCAGGQHHRIVQLLQLGDGDVLPHRDISAETHIVAQRYLLIAARHRLDRLMIGRHAEADQAEGRW